jgi:CubicO group peptidase (beta-lactamase class C family)
VRLRIYLACAQAAFAMSYAITGASAQSLDAEVKQTVERALQRYQAVGAGVSIVHNGETIYAGGSGYRDKKRKLHYTEHTVQNCGSISKTFAADATAILVQDGLLKWDDPISRQLPWFRMKDDWASRQASWRDIFAFRLGSDITQATNEQYSLGYYILDAVSREDTDRRAYVERFQYLSPRVSMRSEYSYGNELFAIPAQMIEEVSSKRFEHFVKERIFLPLGMTSSSMDASAFDTASNRAIYYQLVNGGHVAVPPGYAAAEMAGGNAAGGLHTTADDMAKWMLMHLRNAGSAQKSVIGAEQSEILNTLETTYRIGPSDVSADPAIDNVGSGVALGRDYHRFRGRTVISKEGGNPGISCYVMMIPSLSLGIHVQQNDDHAGRMGLALTYALADLVVPPSSHVDWIEKLAKNWQPAALPEVVGEPVKPMAANKLPQFVGRYSADGAFAGDSRLEIENNVLIWTIGKFRYEFIPWDADKFVVWNRTAFLGQNFWAGAAPADGNIYARFQRDQGKVSGFALEDSVQSILFNRR